jgi:hypothetical protein
VTGGDRHVQVDTKTQLEEVFEYYCQCCDQGISSNEIDNGIAEICLGHEDCTEAIHIRCMCEC